MSTPDHDRRAILLRAAFDFINKLEADHEFDAVGMTIFYDEADCDGSCLRDDIAVELDLEKDTPPLAGAWWVRADHPLARIDQRFTCQTKAENFKRELEERPGMENVTCLLEE